MVCKPGVPSTAANFAQTVTTPDDVEYLVEISIPYVLTDHPEFQEETKATLAGDQGEPAEQGCDQIGVQITQTRQPGLGSIASDEDIVSRVRSVGRVTIGNDGEGAVALLLLERHDCRAIDTVGGASVHVYGTDFMPGMIHTDSLGDGDDCNSVNKVYNGNHTNGIVADESDDGLLPGLLSTAALSGAAAAVAGNATDPIDQVHGGPFPPGNPPEGRDVITRRPVDNRWLDAVRSQEAVGYAKTVMTPTAAAAAGYTLSTQVGSGCNLAGAELTAVKLYVDCNERARVHPGQRRPARRGRGRLQRQGESRQPHHAQGDRGLRLRGVGRQRAGLRRLAVPSACTTSALPRARPRRRATSTTVRSSTSPAAS